MSRMTFMVQPSSATISSFESVVKLECAQVWTLSLRRVIEGRLGQPRECS